MSSVPEFDPADSSPEKPSLTPALKSLILAYLCWKDSQAEIAERKYRQAHKVNPEYKFDNSWKYWSNVRSGIKWLIAGLGKVNNGPST